MEPLTALSLAAAVAQFIDFSAKVFHASHQIAEKGTTVTLTHLENLTHDLINVDGSLRKYITVSAGNQTQPERALYELSAQCHTAADELIETLHDVKRESGTNRTWDNFRAALRSVRSQRKLDELSHRIDGYRHQLSLRLLLVLNAHYAKHDDKLDALNHGNEKIVEVLTVNFNTLRSLVEDLSAEGSAYGEKRRNTIFKPATVNTGAAILSTQSGEAHAITAAGWDGLLEGGRKQEIAKKFVKKMFVEDGLTGITTTTFAQLPENINVEDVPRDIFKTEPFRDNSERILDALHFRQIEDRREAVLSAHSDTFEWVYKPPRDKLGNWSDLSQWLRRGSGCYWVEGKAGSGKSTFMKFMQDHPKTNAALEQWAGNASLIGDSFYFWYAGDELQRSQAGLLRSLLLKVLSSRSNLIPLVFPNIYRELLSGRSSPPLEFTITELRAALRRLLLHIPKGVKVFFLIDGIDEYAGDHNEIATLFKEATKSESIKILLSSRPIPPCVEAFSACPKLRLQDLTRTDMLRLVRDNLGQHKILAMMNRSHEGAADEIIQAIAQKAQGVMLWVVVVIKNVLRGLQEYDSFEELLSMIDELPPDLEQLYELTLRSEVLSIRDRVQFSCNSCCVVQRPTERIRCHSCSYHSLQMKTTKDLLTNQRKSSASWIINGVKSPSKAACAVAVAD